MNGTRRVIATFCCVWLVAVSMSGCLLFERPRYGMACDDESACGEGYTCSSGRCVPRRFLDAAAPESGAGDRDLEDHPADASADDRRAVDSATPGDAADAGAHEASRSDLAPEDRVAADSARDAGLVDTADPDAVGWDLGPGFVQTAARDNLAPQQGDNFGCALVFAQGSLIIGRERSGSSTAGDVVVLQASGTTWHLTQVLVGDAPPVGTLFGHALAAGGNWLAVGDPTYSNIPGEVQLFEQVSGTWEHRGTLARSAPEAGDGFGAALAMSADGAHLIVGGPNSSAGLPDGGAAAHGGAAWLFERTGSDWSELRRVPAPAPCDACAFGSAVAVSTDGATWVVGAPGEFVDGAGVAAGAVWVYRRAQGTWAALLRLTSTSARPGETFGQALALTAGRLAVAVPKGETGWGRVEVFGESGLNFVLEAVITASPAEAGDGLGSSLAMVGDLMAIGALPAGSSAQPVRVLARAGANWLRLSSLSDSRAVVGDGLGGALAIAPDGLTLAVGVPFATVDTTLGAGRVLVYQR